MTEPLRLRGEKLKKTFNRRVIFHDVSFSIERGQTLLITGRNGSGKSTLVKIICGVLSSSDGTVRLEGVGKGEQRAASIGLVAPYLQMYDEFSARENLQLALALRGLPPADERVDDVLRTVGLFQRRSDPVRTYSSGMKQRVKYGWALIHRPPLLIVDEPMANLDADGVAIVRATMGRQRDEGILVVATNDLTDIDRYDIRVDLNDTRQQ